MKEMQSVETCHLDIAMVLTGIEELNERLQLLGSHDGSPWTVVKVRSQQQEEDAEAHLSM